MLGEGEDEASNRIAVLLKQIEEDPAISSRSKKASRILYEFMKAKGDAKRTMIKHLYCFKKFVKLLPKNFDLKKATKEDIERAISKLEELTLSIETRRNIKVVVKSFYKHYLGEDTYYPKQVAWIKTSINKNRKILPNDLLSETEILHMIESASDIRDKTIVALLYDTGVRVGEMVNMKKKDVELDTNPAHVVVSGKTGSRKIPVFFSKPYLAQYINSIKDFEPTDSLFCDIGSWKNMRRPIGRSGVAKTLRILGKKAGIRKRIYPHLFRHSRASFYANKLTEQQLKHYFGWSGSSQMASVYVHLSGRDIDNGILQANGVKEVEKATEPKLKMKVCLSCREQNGIDSSYCVRCGAPLDITVAMQQEKDKELLFNRLSVALKDEKDFKKFVDAIKQRKGKA